MTIAENIAAIREKIDAAARETGRTGKDVLLLGACKMNDADRCQQAVAAGIDALGENRVQEMQEKLPQGAYEGVPLHFIGHLQRNKVRQLLPHVSMIHSIDSERLLIEVNQQAVALGLTVDVLIQLHVAQEETKFGFLPDEALDLLRRFKENPLQDVRLRGVMCMASNTNDADRIRRDFQAARHFFNEAKDLLQAPEWNVRSWGMSADFPLAIEEGATHIRVGSLIFGERQY